MARYLDTLSDDKKAELFQALGSKLTLADLEANPRELSDAEAQELGEKLTNDWQVEKTGGELGEHGIDSALIEEFGSESDKTDYELWLAQNRNHQ